MSGGGDDRMTKTLSVQPVGVGSNETVNAR